MTRPTPAARHRPPKGKAMTQAATPTMTDAELAKQGIERVPGFTYHVGAYRYSNLNDAIAAARRANGQ